MNPLTGPPGQAGPAEPGGRPGTDGLSAPDPQDGRTATGGLFAADGQGETNGDRPGESALAASPPPTSPAPRAVIASHRRRRRQVIVAGLAVVAVVGASTAYVLTRDDGGAPAPKSSLPTATAAITKGDVADTESVDGKLTYSDSRALVSGSSGTVTKTPAEGSTIRQGKTLYRIDNKRVVLMYGSLPLYRTLSAGVDDGPDVRELEQNLRDLGYGDDMTVDKDFTSATTAAVEDWQHDMGLPETGSVDASQVVFEPGPVRISEIKSPAGQPTGRGRPILTVSDTRSVVHVDLDASKQSLARKGAAVSVALPNGRRAAGHITRVGTVAKAGKDQSNKDSSTIDVDITLDRGGTGNLDQAPVTVDMESARVRGVLSVPIEALLGLREGGFGVEVVEGTASRVVPVQLGQFGSGRVQITGAGLREGMKVGVPTS
ncbi:peptidoglycan-binding protein [Actinomadura oligospora]|uniref:peptidoglycan-binding protein n=1 Tax=Actinomadura oligospora TaxID=111804 RepID=UPI0004B1AF18|nr:peptidoglycan-binding protein [Actinomadura oligospora]